MSKKADASVYNASPNNSLQRAAELWMLGVVEMETKIRQIVSQALLVAALLAASSQVNALSCSPFEDILERAELVFTAIPTKASFQPSGVPTPEFAKHTFGIDETALQNVSDDQVIEITKCAVGCRTWKGTRNELPATTVDPWYVYEMEVKRVWRGNLTRSISIFAGRMLPELGVEYLIAITPKAGSVLSFRHTCHPVISHDRLRDLTAEMDNPLYVYE